MRWHLESRAGPEVLLKRQLTSLREDPATPYWAQSLLVDLLEERDGQLSRDPVDVFNVLWAVLARYETHLADLGAVTDEP